MITKQQNSTGRKDYKTMIAVVNIVWRTPQWGWWCSHLPWFSITVCSTSTCHKVSLDFYCWYQNISYAKRSKIVNTIPLKLIIIYKYNDYIENLTFVFFFSCDGPMFATSNVTDYWNFWLVTIFNFDFAGQYFQLLFIIPFFYEKITKLNEFLFCLGAVKDLFKPSNLVKLLIGETLLLDVNKLIEGALRWLSH